MNTRCRQNADKNIRRNQSEEKNREHWCHEILGRIPRL